MYSSHSHFGIFVVFPFPRESCTSLVCCRHHQCLDGRAPPYLLTRGGICVPPTVTYLPYRVSGSTLTAVGRSRLLARWPGTLSWILSGIQRAAQTVLGVYLRRTYSRVTSASSALGVLNDYAPYKSTHSLIHSLTLLSRTSCCSNDSERSHRCCDLNSKLIRA